MVLRTNELVATRDRLRKCVHEGIDDTQSPEGCAAGSCLQKSGFESSNPEAAARRESLLPEPLEDVAKWIEQIQAGDGTAARQIWETYYEQLIALARRRLAPRIRRDADEEDVALSAMNSFYHGLQARRFPTLEDRDELWKILATITIRKVIAYRRRYFAKKRGGGKIRGESVFDACPGQSVDRLGIDQILASEPSPEMAAIVKEQYDYLFGQLEPLYRPVALLKTEGLSNLEIGERLNLSLRTVERRLESVRRIWASALRPA